MKLTRHCLGNINKMLDFYSQFNPSPLSIKQFIDFGEFSSRPWRIARFSSPPLTPDVCVSLTRADVRFFFFYRSSRFVHGRSTISRDVRTCRSSRGSLSLSLSLPLVTSIKRDWRRREAAQFRTPNGTFILRSKFILSGNFAFHCSQKLLTQEVRALNDFVKKRAKRIWKFLFIILFMTKQNALRKKRYYNVLLKSI